jgi:hypothetical protein
MASSSNSSPPPLVISSWNIDFTLAASNRKENSADGIEPEVVIKYNQETVRRGLMNISHKQFHNLRFKVSKALKDVRETNEKAGGGALGRGQ